MNYVFCTCVLWCLHKHTGLSLVFCVKTLRLQQLKVSEEQLHFYSGHVAATVLIKL